VRASVSAPQAVRESTLRGNHLIVEHAPSLSQAKVGFDLRIARRRALRIGPLTTCSARYSPLACSVC